MTGPRRRFDPAEISGHDTDAGDGDSAEATLTARALEASMPSRDASISPDLGDRIMAAVRRERAPRAAGILATLRRRPSPAGVVDSLAIAWSRVVGVGSVALRATALAYMALILVFSVSLSGVAAYSAAGALGWLTLPPRGPDATELVASPRPLQSPTPSEIESPEPSETAEPGETPGEGDSGGGSGGTASPRSSPGEAGGDHEATDTPGPSSEE